MLLIIDLAMLLVAMFFLIRKGYGRMFAIHVIVMVAYFSAFALVAGLSSGWDIVGYLLVAVVILSAHTFGLMLASIALPARLPAPAPEPEPPTSFVAPRPDPFLRHGAGQPPDDHQVHPEAPHDDELPFPEDPEPPTEA